MRILISISLILALNGFINSQTTYFNYSYDPNNTFAIGSSILIYDGDYYFSGATADSITGYQSIFIGKINDEGSLGYWRTYGGYPHGYWAGYTNSLITTTNLGELILSGSRNRPGHGGQAMCYSFNINGDTNYTIQYPDTNYIGQTIFNQGRQTNDNGYIFVGVIAMEMYNSDVLLIKTDPNGQEEWRKNYGKPATWSADQGYNVLETADSGYLIGYYYYIANQVETGNPYVMKVDKLGNYEWEVNLGGPYADLLATTCRSGDGNFICAASISDSVSWDNLFTRVNIFKLSPAGDIIWSKTVGDLHLFNKVYGIYQDHDGGYVMCGFRTEFFEDPFKYDLTRGWICKLDENGDSVWWREYKHFTDPEWHDNQLYDLALTPDGGYVAVGRTSTIYQDHAWVLKVDSLGCDTPGCATGVGIFDAPSHTPQASSLLIYPNPATSEIQLRFSLLDSRSSLFIYDLYGRKQDEIIIPSGQTQTRIDVSGYPSGMYVAVLKNSNGIIGRGKFVKR